jgi:glycerol-3-phosphate O-acyltransferase / dihydroxyacetone phosphate acyltransferase
MSSWGRRVVTGLADSLTGAVFRTIEVRRRGPEPAGAELILASHAGGLADILLVIKAATRFPRFLARDVIWKVPLGATVMTAVGGIPVHRRQDHHGAVNNDGMFDEAYTALADGDTAAIYPEGESVPEPRLAPLRTGAARIALGALARGTDITVSPMGLHFFDVSVLRARAMVDCAEPFTISSVVAELDFSGSVSENNQELVHAVTGVFAERLGEVSNHFDNWEELRQLEVAATTYLQMREPDRAIPYSEIASLAGRISRADGADRAGVLVAASAYLAELEILGVGPLDVPRGAMASAQLAGEAASVAVLTPVAAVGFVINAVGIVGLRLISLTGMAPATAATVKPAYATVVFPATWFALGYLGYRRGGIPIAATLAAVGPLSLAAAVRVGERGQLLWRLGRAVHRARGPVRDQVVASRQSVVDAVETCVDDT